MRPRCRTGSLSDRRPASLLLPRLRPRGHDDWNVNCDGHNRRLVRGHAFGGISVELRRLLDKVPFICRACAVPSCRSSAAVADLPVFNVLRHGSFVGKGPRQGQERPGSPGSPFSIGVSFLSVMLPLGSCEVLADPARTPDMGRFRRASRISRLSAIKRCL